MGDTAQGRQRRKHWRPTNDEQRCYGEHTQEQGILIGVVAGPVMGHGGRPLLSQAHRRKKASLLGFSRDLTQVSFGNRKPRFNFSTTLHIANPFRIQIKFKS
jgi:hypothetical protein